VLATRGTAVEEAIDTAGPAHFAGKLVIDATNPLAPDPVTGGPGLAVGHADSGGERVQRALRDARVVKAFNTVNNALMVDPGFDPRQPMFIGPARASGAPARTIGAGARCLTRSARLRGD
jgi:8-hydroxy-5-deazaflavin:NADPH oxidoreductase